MPTTVTNSIGSGGGRDYSTIALWEDATDNTSLVAADEIRVGECYNDSEFTGGFTIAGATTDATRFRKLTAAAGQSFCDHANVLTNPLTYDQSKGVGIKNTVDATTAFCLLSEANSTVERLQMLGANAAFSNGVFSITTSSVARNCIIKSTAVRGQGNNQAAAFSILFALGKLINSAVIADSGATGWGVKCAYVSAGSGLYNCSIVGTSDGSFTSSIAIETNSSNAVIKNCAVFGPWPTLTNGTFAAASDYNATNAGSVVGSHSLSSLTYASQFQTVTTSGQDFRAVGAGSLDGAGTPDTTHTAGLDIVGQTRDASAPTIGAWEVVAAAGGQPTMRRFGRAPLGAEGVRIH